MISALWLLLLLPISAVIGLILCAVLSVNKFSSSETKKPDNLKVIEVENEKERE